MKRLAVVWILLLVFVCGLATSNANAQIGVSNARSVAMGGAYTAIARGVESPSWNPANLGLKGRKAYRLNLFSFGLGIHNNSFSKKQYELYNGAYLTDQDKQDILNSIPAEGMNFNLNTEVQAMGISIGAFALTATGYAVSDFTLSKDIADLMLNGNDFERTYNIGGTSGEGWGVSSFAVSSSFRFPIKFFHQFSVGFSAKYLKGFAYGKVVESSSTFRTDIDGFHSAGRLVIDRSLGGSGFAFDLGTAAQLNKSMVVGLSFTNLFNSMKWNTDTERFTYTYNADSVSVQKIDDTDMDSVIVDSDESVAIEPFSTKLPSQLRIGFAHITNRFTLGIDYMQGFKKVMGVSTTPRFAVGSEYRLIGFLPLRAGVAFGGARGVTTSAGFAFDFSVFSWDFAVASNDGAFSGKGASFAFNWMFRI